MATVKLRRKRPIYPWPKWTDGKPHRAIAGKHFKCRQPSFVSSVYQYAARNNLSVYVTTEGNAVDFQFSRRKG